MVRKQAPDAGDIYHLDLSPSAGREQAGPHYAVVVSPRAYNEVTQLPFMAPVTTMGRGSRFAGFAVNLIGTGLSVTGVIQVDQIKAIDILARGGRRTGQRLPDYLLEDVLARFAAIFGFSLEGEG